MLKQSNINDKKRGPTGPLFIKNRHYTQLRIVPDTGTGLSKE